MVGVDHADRGDERNGRIRELTTDALTIITRREQATVPFAEIVRIASREPLDRGTGWQLVLTVLARDCANGPAPSSSNSDRVRFELEENPKGFRANERPVT